MNSVLVGEPGGSCFRIFEAKEGESGIFYFDVELSAEGISAKVSVVEFSQSSGNGLISFFQELSENWKGWTGEKTWKSLECHLELVAKHDGFGHILISCKLVSDIVDGWSAIVPVSIDSGSELQSVVKEIPTLFQSLKSEFI